MSASTFVINSRGQWLNGNAAASYRRALAGGCPTGGISSMGAGRTRADQSYLYNGWIKRLPGFNLAAPPGTSKHEKGNALDLTRGTPAQLWMCAGGDPYKVRAGEKLRAHQYGYYRDVPTEPWHFAYYPERDTRAAADLRVRLSQLGHASVASYQRSRGLLDDGKAGPVTWASLLRDAAAPKPAPPPPITTSPEEDDMHLTDRIRTSWGHGTVEEALSGVLEIHMVPTPEGPKQLDHVVADIDARQRRIEAKLDQLLGGAR